MEAYTIAVLNFNGMKVIGPTLDALLRISDEGCHIMVLDNGSTDGSREWVAENYPQLDLRHVADNGDVQLMRNYALQNAETRYLMLCDNDLVLEPDCPRRLLEPLVAKEDVLACSPRMVYSDRPDIIHNDVGRIHFLGVSGRSDRGRSVAEAPPSDDPQPTIPGGIAMIDLERARAIDGFDQLYDFAWADDASFYVRGKIAGLESYNVSAALSYHPLPQHGVARAEGQIHNRYRFMLTQYRGRTLLLTAPLLIPFEIALGALFLLKRLTPAHFRALARIWAERGDILRTRRAIQATRKASDAAYLDASGLSGGGPLDSRWLAWLSAAVNGALGAYWAIVKRLI